MSFKSIQDIIGDTPLVEIPPKNNKSIVLAKLEGNNPGGSVKDRPALNMIQEAENDGLEILGLPYRWYHPSKVII